MTLLGYQEPQILEVFKNTLPTKLSWVLFPITDLRQVVEMAKRILTKEKKDRQLVGQISLTPFMSVRDSFNKRITFDTTDGIEQKIDKLTIMMDKLVTEGGKQDKPFKLRVYQSNRGIGQNRGNYDQRGYQGRFRPNNAHRGHSRYIFNNTGSYESILQGNERYERNNNNRRGSYRNHNYELETEEAVEA